MRLLAATGQRGGGAISVSVLSVSARPVAIRRTGPHAAAPPYLQHTTPVTCGIPPKLREQEKLLLSTLMRYVLAMQEAPLLLLEQLPPMPTMWLLLPLHVEHVAELLDAALTAQQPPAWLASAWDTAFINAWSAALLLQTCQPDPHKEPAEKKPFAEEMEPIQSPLQNASLGELA